MEGLSTSAQAYENIKPRLPNLRKKVEAVILIAGRKGVTASEIIGVTKALDYSVRPRLTELKESGRIYPVGQRKNSRNQNEIVWKHKKYAN